MTMELIEKDPPYFSYPPMKALFMIIKHGLPSLKHPDMVSPELRDFVSRCTQMNPRDRPTATELLAHPFITKSGSYESLIPFVQRARAGKKV
jgi:p21-activated kinase 1